MARKNRRDVFDPKVQGTYHVYSKCIRSMWMLSKGNRDRRAKFLEILEELASIYAIAILASAFLSNHFHMVLVNLPSLVESWSDREVLLRAQRAYPFKFRDMGIHGPPTDEQMVILLRDTRLIRDMRKRLSDISWMVRMLKQRFASYVNQEYEDGGSVWQGRFKMVEIQSEAQLLTTMIYVALNQVRAGNASSLDTSFWTSVCWQLQAREAWLAGNENAADGHTGFIAPLSTDHGPPPRVPAGEPGSRRASDKPTLEMPFDEFIRLARCALELSQGKLTKPSAEDAALMEAVNLTPSDLEAAVAGENI